MGSLAFGALILTLVQIVRIILEYIDHKTKGKADMPFFIAIYLHEALISGSDIV